MLLGVRAELGGLRIDPQMPRAWKRAQVCRKWRGAEFVINIRRKRGTKTTKVFLDGAYVEDGLIPVDQVGQGRREVEVVVP